MSTSSWRAYYPPAWALLSIISFVLSVIIAAPLPTFSADSRPLWLGISIPIATFLYMALFYAICWRHVVRAEESMSLGIRPAVSAPTKEVRRIEKVACMVLQELEHKRIEMVQSSYAVSRNSPIAD
jgi:hypothetical protein